MLELVPIFLSSVALVVSAVTAWATLYNRGSLRMTQPTVVFLGPDGKGHAETGGSPKIYLRTLLYSTGKRGHMIESMHVRVSRNESVQNFNIWVHGDDRLQRGSGLFVGQTGIATNHHFLTPKDGGRFDFLAGTYKVELFARTAGKPADELMWSEHLSISDAEAGQLSNQTSGIYFDWGPDSKRYLSHVEDKPPTPSPMEVLEILTPRAKEQSTAER